MTTRELQKVILEEIRIKMFYDTSKTLTENSKILMGEQGTSGSDKKKSFQADVVAPFLKDIPIDQFIPNKFLDKDFGNQMWGYRNEFKKGGNHDTAKIWITNYDERLEYQKNQEKYLESLPKDIDYVPGYRSFYRPNYGPRGAGYAVGYFPEDATMFLKVIPESQTCDVQSYLCKDLRKYNYLPHAVEKRLRELLPTGVLSEFVWKGKHYSIKLKRPKDKDSMLEFMGYCTDSGECWEEPDVWLAWEEKVRTFMDEWGAWIQAILSIIVFQIVKEFARRTGLGFGATVALEIFFEFLVNLPFAYYQYKKGNEGQAFLELLFSLLPLMNKRTMSFLRIPEKYIGNAKTIAEKLSKRVINDGADLLDFYRKELSQTEQYVFSRVIQQDFERLTKGFEKELLGLVEGMAKNKEVRQKILWKHRFWYRELGAQGLAIFTLQTAKSFFPDKYQDFSDKEFERMVEFMTDFTKEFDDAEKEELQRKMINNPKFSDKIIKQLRLHGQDSIDFGDRMMNPEKYMDDIENEK